MTTYPPAFTFLWYKCWQSGHFWTTYLGAVHKLCRLKGGGVKNCKFYLVKRRLRGGEGVKNCWFWDDIVYGRPPTVFSASREYQLNKSSLGYTFILGTLLIILIFYYWSWRTSFAAEIDLSLQHMCTRKSFLFSPALSKVKIVLSSVPKRLLPICL